MMGFPFFLLSFTTLCFAATSLAYQQCDAPIGTRVCSNGYSTIGFCCNFQDGYYRNCCHYTQVWGLWYFWCGILLLIVMVSGCVGACYKTKRRNNSGRAVRQSQTELGVSNPVGTDVQKQSSFQTNLEEIPPSYQQVQAEGISSQYAEYSKYDSSGNAVLSGLPSEQAHQQSTNSSPTD